MNGRVEPVEGLDYQADEPEQVFCSVCDEEEVEKDGDFCEQCEEDAAYEAARDWKADVDYRESIGD